MTKVIGFVVIAILIVIAVVLLTQVLWNALMPGIFGLKQITYLQAAGLMILARLIWATSTNS